MDKLLIKGGAELSGNVQIAGAKNAALPILAACLLTNERVIVRNVPQLRDISTMVRLLSYPGVAVAFDEHLSLHIKANQLRDFCAPYESVRAMRASFLVLGPLLARFGEAKVALPGGCAIGSRPVDLHLEGLRALGAEIKVEEGYVLATVPDCLRGTEIHFPIVSVGATQNIMMAACLAKGQTVLHNPAREPEIIDLANFLNTLGADVQGAGSEKMTINGVSQLHGGEYRVMPDRIEAGTYLAAAMMTRGDITVKNVEPNHMCAVLESFKQMGAELTINKNTIRLLMQQRPTALSIETAVYPGFPTDMQAQVLAVNAIAKGKGEMTETIFENRFMHVDELIRMGADIVVRGNTAFVNGVEQLAGAPVRATDLRASASLVLAALAAKGETMIDYVYHIDRGYEHIEEKFTRLGASIKRFNPFPMVPQGRKYKAIA